jgi:hypothetical protein
MTEKKDKTSYGQYYILEKFGKFYDEILAILKDPSACSDKKISRIKIVAIKLGKYHGK